MPGRSLNFTNEQFYHVFNRGNDRRDIFFNPKDYSRFLKTFYYYHYAESKQSYSKYIKSKFNINLPLSDTKLVDIICYCLMPNHFHFLVRQKEENGISTFISKLSNSYTKFINTKYSKIGSLFQGTFKAVLVETDEQLIHLSRYIHLNPVVSKIVNSPSDYTWSSFNEYKLGKVFCSTEEVLSFFKTTGDYINFIEDQIDYGISLETLKHSILDDE